MFHNFIYWYLFSCEGTDLASIVLFTFAELVFKGAAIVQINCESRGSGADSPNIPWFDAISRNESTSYTADEL
jgi:hypothetical protein